jgi:periplasmic protein TonB
MLEDCFVESRRSTTKSKPLTLSVSLTLHCAILAVLLLLPVFQVQVAPKTQPVLILPPRWQHKEDRPVELKPAGGIKRAAALSTVMRTPPIIPPTIARIEDIGEISAPDLSDGHRLTELGTGGGGNDPRRIGFIGNGEPPISPPPPPPPAPQAPPPPAPAIYKGPQRVSSGVQQANLIEHITPVYPRLAIQAHVQGTVVLEAVITTGGAVDSLRVVSGHVLLVQAAIDAVRQWRYRPTLLSGQPVEVITTISVNFSFQQ